MIIKQLNTEYKKYADKEITINGWIKLSRDNKSIVFLSITDGTAFKPVQVIVQENLPNFADVAKYSIGSSITVTGKVILTPENKQPFEIKAESVALVGASPESYPLQKKRHSVEFLREIAHLRPRTNLFSAAFKIRSLSAYAIHKYFNEHDYVYVHTPIITTSDCEGAGEMFTVTTLDYQEAAKNKTAQAPFANDFFKQQAYLTVSGQLAGEAFAQAFGRIYTFGPTFRAENSNTARHAAEFWMMEPEVAFCDLDQIIEITEEFLKFAISYILDNAQDELAFLDEFVEKGLIERLQSLVKTNFVRVTYTEAVSLLKKAQADKHVKFENKCDWGDDLATEHERYLTEVHFKKPVFVCDWPGHIKPFYMKESGDGKTVRNFDLLVPYVGELIGGSQRECDYETLKKRILAGKLNLDDYKWYMDLREYGTTPHSGFGMGFERFVMYVTGIQNIRDVLPFPRTPGNAKF